MNREMDKVVEEIDTIVRDRSNQSYRTYLFGANRPGDTWQGWLAFERQSDGALFEGPVETTQPDRDALLYWATGLEPVYIEGALARALTAPPIYTVGEAPAPLVDRGTDHVGRDLKRADLERDILAVFSGRGADKLLTDEIFAALPNSTADVTRAIEHLEKYHRLVRRRTEEGNHWVFLTEDGVRAAGVDGSARVKRAAG
jgi:hypothetical protein